MPDPRQRPTRRPRLSDAETERRMLEAALEVVGRHGMSVGLDAVRLEDVIRDAGVSRTSAYRRWPTRDAFVHDLLVRVAETRALTGVVESARPDAEALADALGEGPVDAAGVRDALVEVLRLAFRADLAAAAGSVQFRTYIGLQATFVGLESDDLRERVGRALAAREQGVIERGDRLIAAAAATFGMRAVAPLGGPGGFEVAARAVAAATTGFLVAALAEPGLLTTRTRLAAHGSTREASWSTPELVLTGIVLAALEPDPDAPPVADLATRVRRLVAAAA